MKLCGKCGAERDKPGRCLPCKSRQNADRYRRETEKCKKYSAEYRQKNKAALDAAKREYYVKNREKILQQAKHYVKNNFEKLRASDRKKKYGLTPESFEAMRLGQNGRCAICKVETQKFHVDHSHVTGKVRGLLCGKCNCGIGQLKDSPFLLRLAAIYLEHHS